ncbi:MAG: hypothetical protein ACXAEN_24315 [Candidatus Thorarchaeota archaeon]|jgi:hypothetical protein
MSFAYKEGVKTFSLTAAQLNALDTAKRDLYTLESGTNRIFVPRYLLLRYSAATNPIAYTTTKLRNQAYGPTHFGDRNKYESPLAGTRPSLTSGAFDNEALVFSFTRTQDNDSTARIESKPIFLVSLVDIGMTSTVDKSIIVMPAQDGRSYTTDKTAFTVRGNGATWSAGNGTLEGELYYSEHSIAR